ASAEAVEVFLPVFDWPMPHEMTLRFRWFRSLPSSASVKIIRQAVEEAVAARRRTFRTCTGCGQPTPPERGGSRCHSCMERLDGVVL
ncbi:MAG: hypothetical protein C4523_14575, partial [Myxococcales bacterium]